VGKERGEFAITKRFWIYLLGETKVDSRKEHEALTQSTLADLNLLLTSGCEVLSEQEPKLTCSKPAISKR
jgi:hypothetical protein